MSMKKSDSKRERISVTATDGSIAVGGDITGGNVINSKVYVRKEQRGDLKAFQELLAELRAGLDDPSLDREIAADVTSEIEGVKKQITREKPNAPMVLGKLKTILEVLSSAAGTAEKLVPTARRLVEMAVAGSFLA